MRTHLKQKLLVGIIFGAMTSLAVWLSGFNPDHRGADAAFVFLVIIVSMALGFTCPIAPTDD